MVEKKKTWRDVTYEVLIEKKKPVHYLDITKEAIKRKNFTGKTPERTIVAELSYEIRGKYKGDRFKALGGGYYGLTEWEEEEIEKIEKPQMKVPQPLEGKTMKQEFQPLKTIKRIVSNSLDKSKILDLILSDLMEMNPYDYEILIAKLFERMGYISTLTPKSKDRGIDVILRKEDGVIEQKTIVQVKRRKDAIGEEYVKHLHSTLMTNPTATQAILLTTSSFTRPAIDFVMDNKLPILLMDGKKVADLVLKYGY